MSVHRPTQALTNICLRSVFLGWRDSSVVKSASCSCRAPRLDPQRLHEGSQPSNSNSREVLGVSDTSYTRGSQSTMQALQAKLSYI